MKVIYFASIKETLGISEAKIILKKPCTILELIEILIKKDKKYKFVFSNLAKVKCAVNSSYVNFNTVVYDKDELAFFPPVTGG